MTAQPKGRDIMAAFHFYDGSSVEQKYEGSCAPRFLYGSSLPQSEWEMVPVDAKVPDMEKQFLHLDNGLIRQTKDIEKVVWSYC